jgi:hypothetical protein
MKLQPLPYAIERDGVVIGVNYLADPRVVFCEAFNRISKDCPPGKVLLVSPSTAKPITPQEAKKLEAKLIARVARSAKRKAAAN